MKQLYLHIETIPSQIHAVREAIFAKAKYRTPGDIPEIKPAANLKDPAKIKADIARRVEKAILDLRALRIKNAADAEAEFRGLAADGYFSHVAVLAYAIDRDPVQVVSPLSVLREMVPDRTRHLINIADEDKHLAQFFDLVEKIDVAESVRVCGHNVRKFALETLFRRGCSLDLEVPVWLRRARASVRNRHEFVADSVDLGGPAPQSPHGHSLDHLCRALSIPGPESLDHSAVYELVLAGRISDVTNHAVRQVRRARSVVRKLGGAKPLPSDIIGSAWSPVTKAADLLDEATEAVA